MYSIKQERNFKSHKKISNNMHYRMIRHFSAPAVVTLVTTLMLMPHIFASDGLKNGTAILDNLLQYKRQQDQAGTMYTTRFHLR